MKLYLVTGGAGFIGSNFIKYMLNKYKDEIKIINLDSLTYAGSLNNLSDIESTNDYIFIKGDICDANLLDEIFRKYDIDYVVNFAAESHVDRSIEDPNIFIKTNIVGTHTLLRKSMEYWKSGETFKRGKKFVQVSTDEVYGSLGEDGFFTETTPLDPHSPYSASKASADLLVKSYYDTYNIPINITRCSNNYGYHQFPEKLIPLVINNCLNGRDIPIYGDGKNVRDWLFVEDHCKAIDIVMNRGKLGEVYNIGGHNELENIEIVKNIINTLSKLTGDKNINESLIKYVEDRKGHDRRYGIDPKKISDELGWFSETKFEVGIEKTIMWYLENISWLEEIVSGEYSKYYEEKYLKGK